MITWIPATDLSVGTIVVERGGSTLEVTDLKPVGRREIVVTGRSLNQSGITVTIPANATVRTIVPD